MIVCSILIQYVKFDVNLIQKFFLETPWITYINILILLLIYREYITFINYIKKIHVTEN